MGIGETVWVVLIGASVLTTGWTLIATIRRKLDLRRAGVNGDVRIMANHAITRECIRLVKHAVLAVAVILAIVWPAGIDVIETRNAAMTIVCVLLALTSLLEIRHRHVMEKRLRCGCV